MFSLLGFGIYVILWWVAFFIMLPIGAHSPSETDAQQVPGGERGAPLSHNLGRKALWAAGLAAVLWLGVYAAAQSDLVGLLTAGVSD